VSNSIDHVFSDKEGLKLMTHIVAGYPDFKRSFEIALTMAEEGADLIEIQIPFSDPLADGSTIMEANRIALENGITPSQCFKLAESLNKKINIPLLFMTYANIPFRMGFEKFVKKSKNCGLSGLIIPDLTFDERVEGYFNYAFRDGVYPINVISPDTDEERLEKILAISKGFIYITLRVGITGAVKRIEGKGINFLKKVKEKSRFPLAAGFGLSSLSQIKQLEGLANMAVVGSHIINLYRRSGLPGIKKFLKEWRYRETSAS